MRKFSFLFFLLIPFIFAIPLAQYQIPFLSIKESRSMDYFINGINTLNTNNYKTSIDFFLKSINIKPDFYIARKFLADSYFLSGDIENSLQEYEILKNQFPHDEYIHYKIQFLNNTLLQINKVSFPDNNNTYFIWKEWNPYTLQIDTFLPIDIKKSNRYLYCLTYKPNAIFVFDLEGNLVKILRDTIFKSFKKPNKIFITKNNIWISDIDEDKIIIYDENLNHIIKNINNIKYPSDIFQFEDIVYIWSKKDNSFYKYDEEGNFLGKLNIKENEFFNIEELNNNPIAFSGYKENIYLLLKNKIYIMDISGIILKEIPLPFKDLKYLHVENDIISVANENTIYYKNIDSSQWNEINNLINNNYDDSLRQENIKFQKISGYYMDEKYLIVLDLSEKMYIFLKKEEWNQNLNLQILNIESFQYPQIAIRLKIRTMDNKTIENLGNHNFEIFENFQKVYLINAKNMDKFKNRKNILIVKDNNFQIEELYKNLFKENIYKLFDEFNINDNVYLGVTGINLKIIYNNKYKVELYDLLEKDFLKEENASLLSNIEQGIFHLIPLKGKNAIIVFTNSNQPLDNKDVYEKIKNLSIIHSIPIYIISFSNNPHLQELAKETNGSFYSFFQNTNYKEIYQKLNSLPMDNYLITYKALTPYSKTLKDKYIHVQVKLNYLEYGGIAEGGYIVP